MSSVGNDPERRFSVGELQRGVLGVNFEGVLNAEELHNILNSFGAVELLKPAKIEQKVLNEIYEGETALTKAAQIGDADLVSLLLEKGADIHKRNEQENTPLWIACRNRNLVVFERLIERGASVKDKIPECVIKKMGYKNISLLQYIVISKDTLIQGVLKNKGILLAPAMFGLPEGRSLAKEKSPARNAPSTYFIGNQNKISTVVSPKPNPPKTRTPSQTVPPKMPSRKKWDVILPDPNASKNSAELKKPINTFSPVPPATQTPATKVSSLGKEALQFLAKEIIYGYFSALAMSKAFPGAINLSVDHPFFLETAGYGVAAGALYLTSRVFFSQQNKEILHYGSQAASALGVATWSQLSQSNAFFLPWFVTKELGQLGVDYALRPGISWLKGKIWSKGTDPVAPIDPNAPPAPEVPTVVQGN